MIEENFKGVAELFDVAKKRKGIMSCVLTFMLVSGKSMQCELRCVADRNERSALTPDRWRAIAYIW